MQHDLAEGGGGGCAWPTLTFSVIGYSVMHSTLPNSQLLEGFEVKFLGSAQEVVKVSN